MSTEESEFFNKFVHQERRERISGLLNSRKKRQKFCVSLPHSSLFESRWIVKIPDAYDTPETVYKMLKKRGAPEECHLVSASPELDGCSMTLSNALNRVMFNDWGTVIICIPSKLGYFEGEENGDRYIVYAGA